MLKPPCDEAVVLSGPALQLGRQPAGRWILAATILGSSMAFIDGTVVNVALPALQDELHATAIDVQWVVESYALLLAALILVGGSLGDLFGRRRIFTAGVGLFTAASAWCGLSPGIQQLILARAIQGVGAAMLVPGSLAIISASFAEQERGRAIGAWSGFTSITAAIGPVLGGWLIQNASWRYAFFLNVPIALVVLLISFLRVPECRSDSRPNSPDWPGALLVTAGLGGVVYGLLQSSRQGWNNPAVITAISAGIAALAAFVIGERRSNAPMLPMSLFRSSEFTGANLLTLFLYAALSGALFFLPLDLIQIQGYTATAAGAALLPFVLQMFLLSRWAGGLVERYGARRPLVIGSVITAGAFLLFALSSGDGGYWRAIFPGTVVLGLGMSLVIAPLTTTVMNAVDRTHAGIASGVNNAVSRVAALLAIATLGIVMLSVFRNSLASGLSSMSLPDDAKQQLENQAVNLGGIRIPAGLSDTANRAVRQLIHDSFTRGFRWVTLISMALALLSAVIAWGMIGRQVKPART